MLLFFNFKIGFYSDYHLTTHAIHKSSHFLHGKGTGQQFILLHFVWKKEQKKPFSTKKPSRAAHQNNDIVIHACITQIALAFCLPAEELEGRILISVLPCSKSPSQYSVNQSTFSLLQTVSIQIKKNEWNWVQKVSCLLKRVLLHLEVAITLSPVTVLYEGSPATPEPSIFQVNLSHL